MTVRTCYTYDENLQDTVYKTFEWKDISDIHTEEGLRWAVNELTKDGITKDMPMIVDKYVELANYKFKETNNVH